MTRATKLFLAAAAVMVAMLVASAAPAMANKNDRNVQHSHSNVFGHNHHHDNDADDLSFTSLGFFPFASGVDVDEENVGPRNDNEGECFVTGVDLDLDGFIAEWEIDVTCFV